MRRIVRCVQCSLWVHNGFDHLISDLGSMLLDASKTT
jgi:hypothetical protein